MSSTGDSMRDAAAVRNEAATESPRACSTAHLNPIAASAAFLADPFAALDRIRGEADLVFTSFLGWRTAIVTAPALAAEILASPVELWHKDRHMRRASAVLGDGLLLSEDETWRRQRRMLNPGFHVARYEAYAEVIREEAGAALTRWREQAVDGVARVDLAEQVAGVTLNIAVRTLFGRGLDHDGIAAVGRAFAEVSSFYASALSNSPLPLPRWLPVPAVRRYHAAVDALDALVGDVIRWRRGEPSGDDLLSILIDARDTDGSRLDDREIRDQAMTFLLAGHETTGLWLVSALALLSLHPEHRADVEAELDASPHPVAADDVLPTTDRALSEALRLRPPAWALSREPTRDTTVGGRPIPAGTIVVIAPWLLHRDPRAWGPDAHAFRPDRFTEAPPARGAWLPFGLGPRKCIGARFAALEARHIVACWLREARIELVDRAMPKLVPSITARPDGPVWVDVDVGVRSRR